MNGELSTHVLMFCLGYIDDREIEERRRRAAITMQRIFRGRRGKWLWKRERLRQRVERRCGKLVLGMLYGHWMERCKERRQRHRAALKLQIEWRRRSITVLLVTQPSGRIRHVKKESVLILRATKVFERYHPMVANYFMSQIDKSAFDRFVELPYWIANPGSKPPASRLLQWFRRERLRRARIDAMMHIVRRKNAVTRMQNAWRCRASRNTLAQRKFDFKQLLHSRRVQRRAESFAMLVEDRQSAKLRVYAHRSKAAGLLQRSWRLVAANRTSMARQVTTSLGNLPNWVANRCSRAWYHVPSTGIQSWWRGLSVRKRNKKQKQAEEAAHWESMARQRRLVFAARLAQRYWRGVCARKYAHKRKAGLLWISSNPFYKFNESLTDVLDPKNGKLSRALHERCVYDPAFPEMGMGVVAWFTRLGLRDYANLFLDAGYEFMSDIFKSPPSKRHLFDIYSQDENLSRAEKLLLVDETISLIHSSAWMVSSPNLASHRYGRTIGRSVAVAQSSRHSIGFDFIQHEREAAALFISYFKRDDDAKSDRFSHLVAPFALHPEACKRPSKYACTTAQILKHLEKSKGVLSLHQIKC